MLCDALMELIEEKGFDSVTVRDLTQRAGLNRGTFYLHYRDKFDLYEQSIDEVWHGFMELAQKADPLQLYQYSQRDEPCPFVIDLFAYIADHAVFFKVMLGPKGDPSFPLRLKESMRKNLYDKLLALQPVDEKMLVPPDFLLAFVTSAHVGVVQYWLESGMALPPKEMALMISRIVRLGPLQTTGIAEVARGLTK